MASIDRRPDGQYRARWREYPGGPQRTKTFKRKIDARNHLANVTVSLGSGTYLTADKLAVTFAQYRAEHVERQVWRDRTVKLAQRALTRCEAILGADRPLSAIRRGDVERLIVRLSTDLAPSTVHQTMQHLRAMLRAAVADGLIVKDPTVGIKLPRTGVAPLEVPTPELVHRLLDAAPASFRVAVALGAFVGLRAGEAQGLTVADVDFLKRVVNVRRQLDGSAALKLVEPKTAASVRSIPVPTMVIDELARHLAQFGPGPDGVILSHHGGFMSDNNFNWLWRCTQRDAGVEVGSLRFHWLRHSFASSLISAGCSVKAVADAMGHGSPTVTLEAYASLWPGDDDRIRSAIDAAWRIEDSLRTGKPESAP